MNRRIAIAVLTTLAATVIGPVGPAAASPFERDIERAKQAERTAGDAVADAERRLATLAARTDELAEAAARASEAYNGARFFLAEAETAERAAAHEAHRTARGAERTRTKFGRVAAATYRAGGQFASLGLVLEAHGTDHFLDGATALRTVTRSQGAAYERAADATVVADEAAAAAERALADRQAAAKDAENASAAAADRVAAHEVQLTAAERERETLVAELAEARGTTIALEEERQARLEMAAAAEREREARQQAERADVVAAAEAGDDGAGTPEAEPPATTSPQATGPVVATATPSTGTPTTTGSEPSAATPSAATPAASTPAASTPAVNTPSASTPATSTPTTRAPAPVTTRSPSPSAAATSRSPAPPKPSPAATKAPAPPAVNASAAQRAIAYARAQLGKPYQWGGAGPNAFDCSGLTMRAWQQGGKSLVHWSVAQANATTRVSYANLRPGDLIFWSDNGQPSGTHHVALYIGGGQMIHAPRPGKNVEVQSVFYWRTPSFYGRV